MVFFVAGFFLQVFKGPRGFFLRFGDIPNVFWGSRSTTGTAVGLLSQVFTAVVLTLGTLLFLENSSQTDADCHHLRSENLLPHKVRTSFTRELFSLQ